MIQATQLQFRRPQYTGMMVKSIEINKNIMEHPFKNSPNSGYNRETTPIIRTKNFRHFISTKNDQKIGNREQYFTVAFHQSINKSFNQ